MVKMGPWRRYEEGWGSIFRGVRWILGVRDGKGVGKTGERECTKGGGKNVHFANILCLSV